MTEMLNDKIPCHNYGVHCLNPCVGQCDLGDGIQWYCRCCIENIEVDIDDLEPDDSLIFCETEWKKQGGK